MKYLIATAALALVGCATSASYESPAADMTDEQMMQERMKWGTPGAHHEALAPLVGEWTVEMTTPARDDMEAQTYSGTATSEWIMDGRFLREDFNMDWEGMPFQGVGVMGYDNFQKQYQHVWMDDMNTGMSMAQGTGSGGEIQMSGTVTDFSSPQGRPFRIEMDIVSDDEHTMRMVEGTPDGSEQEIFTIRYTRAS